MILKFWVLPPPGGGGDLIVSTLHDIHVKIPPLGGGGIFSFF